MECKSANVSTPHSSLAKKILVCIAAVLIYGIGSGICANNSLLSTEISISTGLDYGEVSLAFTVMNLVLAFSVPVFGFLTVKIKCLYMIIFGAIMISIGFLGASFSSTLPALIIFLGIIFGIGAAAISFTVVYTAAKPFFGEKGSAILSGMVLASQGGLGFILSFVIGDVTSNFGLNVCMGLIAVVSLCFIPFAFAFLQRKKQQKTTDQEPQKIENTNKAKPSIPEIVHKILTHPFFYLLFFGVFTFAMADGLLVNHASQMAYEMFPIEEDGLSIVTTIYTIGLMTGALTGGIVSSRVKNRPLILSVLFLSWTAVNFIFIVLCKIYLDTGSGAPILNIILFFLSAFLIHNCFVLVVGLASEHVSAVVCAIILGILDSLAYLTYSLNSFLGGLFHETIGGFNTIYLIVYVTCLLGGVLFLAYGLKHKNKKPECYI